MTAAMEALYLYAQENTFRIYLAQVRSYPLEACREDRYTERLRVLLDEDGQTLLDDLLRTKENVSEAECAAAFQAGIHAAFELIRL